VRIVEVTLQETELTSNPTNNTNISTKLAVPGKKMFLSSRQKGQIDQLIRLFVPKPIGEELDNATGLNYFAEIREVTTIFMKVRFFSFFPYLVLSYFLLYYDICLWRKFFRCCND